MPKPSVLSSYSLDPPWHLTGSAFVLNYWLSPNLLKNFKFFTQNSVTAGRLVHILLIRYKNTPVGPYDALVLIDHPIVRKMRISTIPVIFVSSAPSIQLGQDFWGLSKQLASFDWQEYSDYTICTIRFQQEEIKIQLEQHKNSPTIYINSHQIPEAILNFKQRLQQTHYQFVPKFRSKICKLKQVSWPINADFFPNLNQARYIQSFYIADFELILPQADQTSLLK